MTNPFASSLRVAARIAALVVPLLLPAATAAQPVDSVYSRFDWQSDCTVTDSPSAADESWVRLRCPGPGPYSVFVADDDQRMSLDYGRVRGRNGWESFTSFNHVHTTVEWRRRETRAGMTPFATIHRWFVHAGDQKPREVLVVSTIAESAQEQSCMVGFVDAGATPQANRVARRVADRHAAGFTCGVDRPRYHGRTTDETPRPSLPRPDPAQPDDSADAAGVPQVLPMLRRYWDALGHSNAIAATQRFRLAGAPAHDEVRSLAADASPRPAHRWTAYREFLTDTYRIGGVETLASTDGERHLRVRLEPRIADDNARSQYGTMRLALDDGRWKITSTEWTTEMAAIPAPWVMIQQYWHDIRRARDVRSLSASRGEDSPADHWLKGAPVEENAGDSQHLERLLRLAETYRIADMTVLVASDAERRVGLELTRRNDPQGERLWGEVGIVRTDQGWKIGMEQWGLNTPPS